MDILIAAIACLIKPAEKNEQFSNSVPSAILKNRLRIKITASCPSVEGKRQNFLTWLADC